MFFYERLISEAELIEKLWHLKLNVFKSLPPRLTWVFAAVASSEGGLGQTFPIDKIENKRLFLGGESFLFTQSHDLFRIVYDFVDSDSRTGGCLSTLGSIRRIGNTLRFLVRLQIWQVSTTSHGSTSAEELPVIPQKPTC